MAVVPAVSVLSTLAGRSQSHESAARGAQHDRVFVTAGTGSGKTRVILEKVRHVVRKGAAQPDEIAIVTLTNKATEEVRGRPRDIDGVTVETIHRLAMQPIEQRGLRWPQISPLAQDTN